MKKVALIILDGWGDYELWLRLGYGDKKINFIDGEVQTYYRVHSDSMINNISSEKLNQLISYIQTKYNLSNSLKTIEKEAFESNIFIEPENNIQNQNLQNNNPIETLFEPFSEIPIQIFWANEECHFTEERSMYQHLDFNINPKGNLRFLIPCQDTNVNYLRFDLGDRVGFININNILIQSNEGNIIWEWKEHEIKYKNNIILIEGGEYFQNKILQLSLNSDPQFIVNLSELKSTFCTEELIVDLYLSPLDDDQIELFSKSIARPLSFTHLEELESAKEELIRKMEEQNVNNKTINSLKANIVDLEKENTSVNSNCESKSNTILDLIRDKEVLSEELSSKTQIVNQIFTEKGKLNNNNEYLVNKISVLENVAGELDKTKNQLEIELVFQQEKYSTITGEKDVLNNKLIEFETLTNELNKTKNQLEKDVQYLQEKYSDSQIEKNTITMKVVEAEVHINDLTKAKIELEKDLSHQREKNLSITNEKNILLEEKTSQERKYNEIIEQKEILTSTANKQQDFIQVINNEKQKILEQKDELIQLLNTQKEQIKKLESDNFEMKQKNKEQKESLFELNEKNNIFIDEYEQKNLIQIAYNRIRRKK